MKNLIVKERQESLDGGRALCKSLLSQVNPMTDILVSIIPISDYPNSEFGIRPPPFGICFKMTKGQLGPRPPSRLGPRPPSLGKGCYPLQRQTGRNTSRRNRTREQRLTENASSHETFHSRTRILEGPVPPLVLVPNQLESPALPPNPNLSIPTSSLKKRK